MSSLLVTVLMVSSALCSVLEIFHHSDAALARRHEWYNNLENLKELGKICRNSDDKRSLLVARGPPAGYTNVEVGDIKTARSGRLWTENLVSCIGIAMIGDQHDGNKDNQILAHLVYVAVPDTGNFDTSDGAKKSMEEIINGLMGALKDETELQPKLGNHANEGSMQIDADLVVKVYGNRWYF
ncbi:Uu.00g124320.m01.CDS01 [Anthostomella pinea]|uniref:Uu.00g124320.m01.CDS01 n=1 Tax=Anthostomella pinea TaxID=933095 RepID=A0AAI8YF63_9PEZI|nr:Uu.00g124320.m01.CDS01 [Anthostomella pinea]